MRRLLTTVKLDAQLQLRNNFYSIGIGLAVIMAFGMNQFFAYETFGELLPVFFLLAVGGTTMMYVAGLLIFEKDQRTLDAMLVSPLRRGEYMAAKLISLTLLATLESLLLVLLTWGLINLDFLLLIVGIVALGAMLMLVGFTLVVRYDSITDFLIPALVVALLLEVPFLYFLGLWDSPLQLLIPTSAPTMLIVGAWRPLAAWELLYGVGYSVVWLVLLYRWALAAFNKHIVLKAG